MIDVSEIEKRVDRAVTAAIPMNVSMGGVQLASYVQMMELAKTMATCRAAIPAWLRASVGDCLSIWQRAARWGLDPYFVAEKSYMMTNRQTGETKIAFESQLIHAVIESLAPLKGRLRHKIVGTGDERYCEVWGTFKGEDAPHIFKSETLGKRVKDIGKSEKGYFRGSPLWLQKPEVQLFYDASRDWARINCPDVLAGVYTRDELTDHDPVDVTPSPAPSTLAERLRAAKDQHAGDRGFDADHIKNEVAKNGSTVIDGSANSDAANEETGNEPDNERDMDQRVGGGSDRGGDADDQGGSEGVDAGTPQGGEAVAGSPEADGEESDQVEIFPPDRKQPAPQSKKRKR
jgi:hypothetical protein